MTPIRAVVTIVSLILVSTLVACGKDNIRTSCDEIQPYQTVVAGKRIVVPEGLDSLDQYKEMPIPKAETPPRPKGAICIDYPPAIQ